MKNIFPLLFFLPVIFSFRTGNYSDSYPDNSVYYDSISYYPDSTAKYVRLKTGDSNFQEYYFYPGGLLSREIVRSAYGYSQKKFFANGLPSSDSTTYGWYTRRTLFNANGKIFSVSSWDHLPVSVYGCRLREDYFFDADGNVSRYARTDSTGKILIDRNYPFSSINEIKFYESLYPGTEYEWKVKEKGFYLRAGEDTFCKTGLWQTYFSNGRMASLGYYVNNKLQGLFFTFDSLGKPLDHFYYENGTRSAEIEKQITRFDTIYREPRFQSRREFRKNGKSDEDGLIMDTAEGGYVYQFIYFNGNSSITGVEYYNKEYYNDEHKYEFPVFAGERYSPSYEFHVRGGTIIKRKINSVQGDILEENYEEEKLYTKKNENDFRSYYQNNYYGSAGFIYPMPGRIKLCTKIDSSIWMGDTVKYFGDHGRLILSQISGTGYRLKTYDYLNEKCVPEKWENPEYAMDYVKLPNGKWFMNPNTNISLPGETKWITRNNIVTWHSFRTQSGWLDKTCSYSANTGKLLTESYYEEVARKSQYQDYSYYVNVQVGKYREYSENGFLLEEGTYDKDGKQTGVQKKYNGYSGGLTFRARFVNGKYEGVVYEDCCCYTRKQHSVPHRSFYINGKKIINLRKCHKKKRGTWPY
ncbi:MAG: hypothetical protein HY064_00015 [Bacteroidetes bacterium]|nr:hypothetical protein [Bacteroidota bacterium]